MKKEDNRLKNETNKQIAHHIRSFSYSSYSIIFTFKQTLTFDPELFPRWTKTEHRSIDSSPLISYTIDRT